MRPWNLLTYAELGMRKGCFSVPVRALFLQNFKSRQWLHLPFTVMPEEKWLLLLAPMGANIYRQSIVTEEPVNKRKKP